MIRVFHGDDEFGISEAVREFRADLGDDVVDSNTARFEGRDFKPGEVIAAARTVPFLADRRLVLVTGLLRRMERTQRTQRRGAAGDTAPMRSSGWDTFGGELKDLPETTELVFVDVFPGGRDAKLRPRGAALRSLEPAGRVDVREFVAPRGRAVQEWIRAHALEIGVQISPSAVARLADLVGPQLRLLDQEIRKLALYAGERAIQPGDVGLMVAPAREANIFAAVDAVLERRPGIAMRSLYGLFDDGAGVGYILTMLARQTRFLILARHLRGTGLKDEEIGERIGLRAGFALRKTLEQASRFDPAYLAAAHRGLLDADLDVKSGAVNERVAVEMLVARLSGLR